MSSDGFSVDLDALGVARDRVGRLVDELTDPPDREVPGADVFGHSRLAEAANEFGDREKRGLTELADEADSIRRRLADTIASYRKADHDGADLFRSLDS